jgi:hypothetical protein
VITALFLAAAVWAAPPQADPTPIIESAAAARPNEPFESEKALPEGFLEFLKKKGYPSPEFTNKRVAELLDEYKRSLPRQVPLLPAPGEKKPEPRKEESNEAHGLKLFGLEFGTQGDALSRDNEPYLHKGVDQVFDWNIRPRLALDGVGASADYRHPHMRSLSVGFMKYWDWPASIGLDGPRDKVYSILGQTPSKPYGGFAAGISGALNPYVGGRTLFDWRQAKQGDQDSDVKRVTLGTGFSPMGDNVGKRWNVTLLNDLIWEDGHITQPGYDVKRSGFGYSMGAAFQYAIGNLGVGWIPPPPTVLNESPDAKHKPATTPPPQFYFDRLLTKTWVSQSQLSSFGINTSAQISFYLLRYLKLMPELTVTYKPAPDPGLPGENRWGIGFNLGIDIRTNWAN